MALVDVRGYGLDAPGAIQNALANALVQGQNVRQAAQQQQLMELQQRAAGVGAEQPISGEQQAITPQQALARMSIQFPEKFESISKSMGMDTQQKKEEAADFAYQLKNTPFDRRQELINVRITNLQSKGRDPKDTASLLGMDEAQQNQALEVVQMLALSPQDRIKLARGDDAGKLGTYNPRDYTTDSWAEFVRTRDPSKLERFSAKTIDIGGVPHALMADGTYAPIKSTEQVAKSKADIEIAVTSAREQAKVDVQKAVTSMGAMDKLDDADRLYSELSQADLGRIYGFGEAVYPDWLRTEEGVTLQAKRDQLIGMLQLAGRGELKGQGPITEGEQAIVAKAATILNSPNISPATAKKELDNAMNILYRNAGKKFDPTKARTGKSIESLTEEDLMTMSDEELRALAGQ